MRCCDKRFEMRLPEREKNAAEAMAESRGVTVSELLRRALRAYTNLPEPLGEEDRISVAGLRRRINLIESRIDADNAIGIATDLKRARTEAKALLRR